MQAQLKEQTDPPALSYKPEGMPRQIIWIYEFNISCWL